VENPVQKHPGYFPLTRKVINMSPAAARAKIAIGVSKTQLLTFFDSRIHNNPKKTTGRANQDSRHAKFQTINNEGQGFGLTSAIVTSAIAEELIAKQYKIIVVKNIWRIWF
jgi:hypothetical protein